MENKTNKKGLAVFWLVVGVIAVLIATTFNSIKNGINLGLDLQGGFEILYEVTPLNEDAEVDMTAVVNSISKRINVLGVSEPSIVVEGENRIRVQLAGVEDQESARQMLGTTANLTFRDVNDEELADSSVLEEGGASLAYQDGLPIVSLKIADQAKFAEITKTVASKTSGENIMIVWLDWEEGDTYKEEYAKSLQGEEPKYISAATVNSEISGDCIIQGNFTEAEARTLANLINSGSLPVKLTEISSNVVSASYGEDALHKTALAGIVGILLVILFMIWQYRLGGLISGVMLAFYIWAIFALYKAMGAVFTLSGIGALVLGVGMTVDANIINYERIRQELYKGRSVRSAVEKGATASFSAVFDAQFTTLIAAVIMYVWGNGAVKGFATMLIITVIMTLLINVAFSKWMLKLVVNAGVADGKPELFNVSKKNIPDVNKGESQFYTGTKAFDYVKNSKMSNMISAAILALGLIFGCVNAARGAGFFNLGIDFASGTKLTVSSEQALSVSDVEAYMEELGYDNFSYQSAGEDTVYAVTKDTLETEDLFELKANLTEKFGVEPGDSVVTPVVGRDLVRNAFILTIVAWIAMMAYVAFRYEWNYALGCIIALVHDVLIVLAFFAIFRFEVNTEVISVLLTIIGYSINNSIVVFDRVRELMADKKEANMKAADYDEVVNKSLDATIVMSLFSSISTLLPVICLLLMGSRSIFTFIFAMFIGLIAGTVSSIFVAPTVWRIVAAKNAGKPTKKKKNKEYKEALDEYTIKGINA